MKSASFKNRNLIVFVKSLSPGLRCISLATVLLLELTAAPSQAAVLLSQDFNASDGGFTVDTPIPYDGPWVYSAATGSWTEAGQAAEDMHPNTSTLISPAINVPQAGPVELTFVH